MLSQGQVGPITSTADGVQVALRQGKLGDQIVSELHGRYYETCYRRNQFFAANPTGVTTVAFTSGTTTALLGVCVSNPVGSSINCVLNKFGYSFPVINTTVNEVLLAVGYNAATNVTHTTALTTRNGFIGVGAASVAFADASWTCPTAPNTLMLLTSMPSATTLPADTYGDFEGSIILPPGAYAMIITSAASAVSGFKASLGWEEVPV